jgi:nickel-dependent lactate racemase
LAHEDSQKEDEERHSDEMLTKWNEEIKFLEILLMELESGRRESKTRKQTCLQVPNSDRKMLLASKEVEENFNFQIKLKDADIEENDEHQKVIRKRDSELFLKEERRPQI